jgi:hypothetical protein
MQTCYCGARVEATARFFRKQCTACLTENMLACKALMKSVRALEGIMGAPIDHVLEIGFWELEERAK